MPYKNITIYSETDMPDEDLIDAVDHALTRVGVVIHDIDVAEVEA